MRQTSEPLVPVEEWLTSLRARNRIASEHTERAYRGDMRRWAKAFGHTNLAPLISDLIAPSIEAAIVATESMYSTATRNRMWASLSGLCGWLFARGFVDADPTSDRELTIRQERRTRLPKHFTDDQVRRIATACAIPPERATSRLPVLDRALLAVLIGTGVRAAELCDLRVRDVLETRPRRLQIRGKGDRERRIKLHVDVARKVDSWLDTRDRRCQHDPVWAPLPNSRLFIDHKARPFTTQRLNARILSWLHQADIQKPDGVVAHAFRHTFGYKLAGSGVPLPVVQELMGHADIKTTSVYTKMTSADHDSALDRLDLDDLIP